jgi:NADH-quinone oxidoreductase subunit J
MSQSFALIATGAFMSVF